VNVSARQLIENELPPGRYPSAQAARSHAAGLKKQGKGIGYYKVKSDKHGHFIQPDFDRNAKMDADRSDRESRRQNTPDHVKRYLRLKKAGVQDAVGALADELYSDVGFVTDMLGDLLHSVPEVNSKEKAAAVLDWLIGHGSRTLKAAASKIRDHSVSSDNTIDAAEIAREVVGRVEDAASDIANDAKSIHRQYESLSSEPPSAAVNGKLAAEITGATHSRSFVRNGVVHHHLIADDQVQAAEDLYAELSDSNGGAERVEYPQQGTNSISVRATVDGTAHKFYFWNSASAAAQYYSKIGNDIKPS